MTAAEGRGRDSDERTVKLGKEADQPTEGKGGACQHKRPSDEGDSHRQRSAQAVVVSAVVLVATVGVLFFISGAASGGQATVSLGPEGKALSAESPMSSGIDSHTATVRRSRGDGTVYQTGTVATLGTVEPGDSVSVSAEITAEIDAARTNIVYAVLGLDDGTIIDVQRMGGSGSGTVTTAGTVPESAGGKALVWSFYPVISADSARSSFQEESTAPGFAESTKGAQVATVSGDAEGTPPAEFSATAIDYQASFEAKVPGDEEVERYEWEFGDGTTAEGQRVTHTYDAIGSYEVTLTTTDSDGRTNSTTKTVDVLGVWDTELSDPASIDVADRQTATLIADPGGLVTARQQYDEASGDLATIAFDFEFAVPAADVRPTVRVWDDSGVTSFEFGDANTASGSFERTVDATGSVTVEFVLRNGQDSQGEATLDVRNLRVSQESGDGGDGDAPTAAFVPSETEPERNESVTFDAGSSSAEGTIESFRWDLGDGTTASGRTVEHSYTTPGTYAVELSVTDGDGITATTEQRIRVRSAGDENDSTERPDLRSVTYGSTETGFVDDGDPYNETFFAGHRYEPVTFDGTAGDVVSIEITTPNDPSVRLWGPDETLVSASDRSAVELPANGTYTIEVGFIGTDTGEYTLTLGRENDKVPRAAIEFSPAAPAQEEQITFESNVDDNGDIEAYEWSFSDGRTRTGAEVRRAFDETGEYTVTLTVTDDEGLTDTTSTNLTVVSILKKRYDTDGDGLELDELEQALKDLKREEFDGNITVEQIRELIEERSESGDSEECDDDQDTDDDGLSDCLEMRGIPVTNTYEYGEVAGNANVTEPLEDDPDEIKRLKTNPFDADTDGDGLDDGEEVGERKATAEPGGHEYYELNSDPTDPNTDDAGMDDQEEVKQSSNPKNPEYISINAALPVRGLRGCNPEGGDGPPSNCAETNDGAYMTKPAAKYANFAQDRPNWLSNLEESKLEEGEGVVYYLLTVQIETETSGDYPDALPDGLRFAGFSRGSTQIIGVGPTRGSVDDGYVFNPFPGGSGTSQTAYLAVKSSTSGDLASLTRLGRLEVEVRMEDGQYARSDISGQKTLSFSTATPFRAVDKVPGTSVSAAKAMVKEATKKFGQAAVSTSFPATGGALGAAEASVLSGARAGTLIAAEGIALFTDDVIRPGSAVGPDDLVAKGIISEGAIPAYIDNTDEGADTPTANVGFGFYREN